MQKESALILFLKSIFFLIILYFSYLLIFKKVTFILLDHLNLLIHEAGHLVFYPFGDFMQTLGGSIMQILIPSLFVIYFLKRRDLFSSSFSIFWIGSNLIDISIYISDAKYQILPLIGGGSHDWNILLSRMRLLGSYNLIGNIVYYFGTFTIVVSLILFFVSLAISFSKILKE